MQQQHAVVVEQGMALAEEGIVEADADMLEHADRDDAIEFLRHVAIVLQAELDFVGQSSFGRAHLREGMLLLRERDAGHACAAELAEIERKTAPAAADIEHVLIRREQKLSREVALLGE